MEIAYKQIDIKWENLECMGKIFNFLKDKRKNYNLTLDAKCQDEKD